MTKTVVHRYTFLINKCTVGRLNMKYTLTGKKIDELAGNKRAEYPKYTSQLINIANQNARGTRADVVGQLSELFEEFRSSGMEITLENWRAWYMKRYPDTIEASVRKIERHVENLRCAMQLIDHDLILRWVDDLVIDKTFAGLNLQKAILASLAERLGCEYRLATPEEESKGIDGYVGDTAYSVKPDTYRSKASLPERIDVKMIYYKKNRGKLELEIDD